MLRRRGARAQRRRGGLPIRRAWSGHDRWGGSSSHGSAPKIQKERPRGHDRRAILLAAQCANKAETILPHTLPWYGRAPRSIRALICRAAWLASKEEPRWHEQKAVCAS